MIAQLLRSNVNKHSKPAQVESPRPDLEKRFVNRTGVSNNRFSVESLNRIGSYPLRQSIFLRIETRSPWDIQLRLVDTISPLSDLKGIGQNRQTAIRDWERQIVSLIETKVRIAIHERDPKDDSLRAIINYLIDWDRYVRENPKPSYVCGVITGKDAKTGLPIVRWSHKGNFKKSKPESLALRYWTPYFAQIPVGSWFKGVLLETDPVEWIEPPHVIDDPTHLKAAQVAWNQIPVFHLDDPDAWPRTEE